jgi:exodeoxyribonuclease VII large subunit
MTDPSDRPSGIPGSGLSGPWPVGQYAAGLRDRLRAFTRVQVFGELVNFKRGQAKVWFELRDASGALPCSMWRRDWEAMDGPPVADGAIVVAAGGCDFYPGSRTSSPSFSFVVSDLRPAGEGDLLAQLDRLRRRLTAEGLCERQGELGRPGLPRAIGVVCGEHGKARDDILAGLERRGWAGRIVWAFAPVQDRHAAPRITRALQDLAACAAVDVVIVARGGGSLADLLAFCDETLCRTIAMLPVPVIASVGHHTDRTLIDDVAAVSCSTPTHAAEAAVPVDCREARRRLRERAERLDRQGRRAILGRAHALAGAVRAPAEQVARHRARLHQQLREIRAGARRGAAAGRRDTGRLAISLERRVGATTGVSTREAAAMQIRASTLERAGVGALRRHRSALAAAAVALEGHDPQRTLERGYALVEDRAGRPVTSAAAARSLVGMKLRLRDGSLDVRPDQDR